MRGSTEKQKLRPRPQRSDSQIEELFTLAVHPQELTRHMLQTRYAQSDTIDRTIG